MEIQIQELIDKIKTEGVEKAEKAAAEMMETTRQKAAAIVEEAKKAAEIIISDAKVDADKFQATGKQAVIQAGRDMLLNIRAQIGKILAALIETEAAGVMNKSFLESTLITLVNKWADKGNQELEILLPEADLRKLEDFFKVKLKERLKAGVEIRPVAGIEHGFKIAEKDGSAFFDLTDQGIAECLKPYLNAKLYEYIDAALK